MKATFSLLFLLLCLTGCTTTNSYVATGNPSEKVLTLSYYYHGTGHPALDSHKANHVAAKKCEAWGYDLAEAVGGETKNCTRYTGHYECYFYRIDKQYQCLDSEP